MRRRRSGGWHLLFCLVLIGGGLLLYASGFGNSFFNDDFVLLKTVQSRPLSDFLLSRHPDAGAGEPDNPYWRPGWYLLLKSALALFGLDPLPYMVTGVLLHLAVALLLYALLCGEKAPPWAAFLAAAFFLASPADLEAVFWPAASLNVLPAALFLLAAVYAAMRYARSGTLRSYGLMIAAAVLSLAFKEAAYTLPFVFAAAVLFLDERSSWKKRASRALLGALPLLLIVAVHFLYLNVYTPGGLPLKETIGRTLQISADYYRALLPLPASTAGLYAVLVPCAAALLFAAPARLRFFTAWYLLAVLPFSFISYASRLVYFSHLPFALLVGCALAAVAARGRRGRGWLSAAAAAAVCVLAVVLGSGVRHAIAGYRYQGECCKSILRSFQDDALAGESRILVDSVPACIQNGLPEMIDLELGRKVEITNLHLYSFPPFLVYGNPLLETLPPETPLLRCRMEKKAPGALPFYEKTTLGAILAEGPRMPLIGFRSQYEVMEPKRALGKIRAGQVDLARVMLLDEPPPFPIPAGGAEVAEVLDLQYLHLTKVRIRVRCPVPVLLFLGFPILLDRPGAHLYVDGSSRRPLIANGRFNAVALPEGIHVIEAGIY